MLLHVLKGKVYKMTKEEKMNSHSSSVQGIPGCKLC